jgi:hypothetical protein
MTVTATYFDAAQAAQQHTLRTALLVVTGLNGSALNAIPHGLPNAPIAVFPLPYSANGSGAATISTLDGSNGTYGSPGATTGGSGFDSTSIYVYASATTAQFLVIF